MSIPIRIDVDGFKFTNESIEKGEVFSCPNQFRANWMVSNGVGTILKRPKGYEPAFEGSWKLVKATVKPKRGTYSTRQMKAGEDENAPRVVVATPDDSDKQDDSADAPLEDT